MMGIVGRIVVIYAVERRAGYGFEIREAWLQYVGSGSLTVIV